MFNGIRVLINFLKSSELLDRLIQTVYYVLIFRLGTYIVLPGVDEIAINSGRGGLLGLLDSFVGGAFARKSIFSLGVMPYISASIIVHFTSVGIQILPNYFQDFIEFIWMEKLEE